MYRLEGVEGASSSGRMENSSVVKMGRGRDEGRCESGYCI